MENIKISFKEHSVERFEQLLAQLHAENAQELPRRLNVRYGINKDTLLHTCSLKKLSEKAKLLIKYGASQKIQRENGDTPLHVAAVVGSLDMSKVLLKEKHLVCGEDCDCGYELLSIENEKGRSPKVEASYSNREVKIYLTEEEILYWARRGKNMRYLCDLIGDKKEDNINLSTGFFRKLIEASVGRNYLLLLAFGVSKISHDRDQLDEVRKTALEEHKQRRKSIQPYFFLSMCYKLLDDNDIETPKTLAGIGTEELACFSEDIHLLNGDNYKDEFREFFSKSETIQLLLCSLKNLADVFKLALLTKLGKNKKTDWRCLDLDKINKNWLERFEDTTAFYLQDNKLKKLPTLENFHHLEKLDLSHNNLQTVNKDILELPILRTLTINHNSIKKLPKDVKFSDTLSHFYINHNLLKSLPSSLKNSCISFLEIGYNRFESLPLCICEMPLLKHLALDGNKGLIRFPNEIGNMRSDLMITLKNMEQLAYPQPLCQNNVVGQQHQLISYHRSLLYSAQRNDQMHLLVIGPSLHGKSTLINSLLGLHNTYPAERTRDLQINSKLSFRTFRKIISPYHLKIMDFPGDIEYSTNQCFFTERSLYLIVWNVTKGVDNLKEWFGCLATYVPNANVMIAGTHSEKVGNLNEVTRTIRNWLESQGNRYSSMTFGTTSDFAHRKHELKFGKYWFVPVSNVRSSAKNIGIKQFKKKLFHVSLSIKNSISGDRVLGERLPKFYFKLGKKITARRQEHDVIIDYDSMLSWLSQSVQKKTNICCCRTENTDMELLQDNIDIRNLQDAVKFLQDIGVLLHFKKTAYLKDLYFSDRIGLKDILQRLSDLGSGLEGGKWVFERLLREVQGNEVPDDTTPYTNHLKQILDMFHAGFRTPDGRIQLTQFMKTERPDIDPTTIPAKYYYHRFHTLHYIPFGFWVKFISRLLQYLDRYLLESNDLMYFDQSYEENLVLVPSYVHYWRSGVIYNDTVHNIYLEVKQIDEDTPGFPYCNQLRGKSVIESIVKSDDSEGCARLISSIADDLRTIMFEWHKSLTELINFNESPVQQFAPCQICLMSSTPVLFSWEDCLKAFLLDCKDDMICSNHNYNKYIPIQELFPEILFYDHPLLLLKECHSIQIERDLDAPRGGYGKVFNGTLTSHSECNHANEVYNIANKEIQFSVDQLAEKFQEFRQEVLILNKVSVHPNIISMFGIRVQRVPGKLPVLAIVMERAPLGSLASERRLDRAFIYRYSYQIAIALRFFHHAGIVHRDIKPENIMIFDRSTVKIIDFGLANFMSSTGLAQDVGTLRYLPPEVLVGKASYTEAVDVWCFALVMYEMVTGKYTFEGVDNKDIEERLKYGHRPDFGSSSYENKINSYLSMTNLVKMTWKTSPSERPSASALSAILISPCFQLFTAVWQFKSIDEKKIIVPSCCVPNIMFYSIGNFLYRLQINSGTFDLVELPYNEDILSFVPFNDDKLAIAFSLPNGRFKICMIVNALRNNQLIQVHDTFDLNAVLVNQSQSENEVCLECEFKGEFKKLFNIPQTETSQRAFSCYYQRNNLDGGVTNILSAMRYHCGSLEKNDEMLAAEIIDVSFVDGVLIKVFSDYIIISSSEVEEKTVTTQYAIVNIVHDKEVILVNERNNEGYCVELIRYKRTDLQILMQIEINLMPHSLSSINNAFVTSLAVDDNYFWIGTNDGSILICQFENNETVIRARQLKPYKKHAVEHLHLIKDGPRKYVMSYSKVANETALPLFKTFSNGYDFFTRDFLMGEVKNINNRGSNNDDNNETDDVSDLLLFWCADDDLHLYPTDKDIFLNVGEFSDEQQDQAGYMTPIIRQLTAECY